MPPCASIRDCHEALSGQEAPFQMLRTGCHFALLAPQPQVAVPYVPTTPEKAFRESLLGTVA